MGEMPAQVCATSTELAQPWRARSGGPQCRCCPTHASLGRVRLILDEVRHDDCMAAAPALTERLVDT